MTIFHPGDTPCGRCNGAILPSENRFSATDDAGEPIIICQECRDAAHDTRIEDLEGGFETLADYDDPIHGLDRP